MNGSLRKTLENQRFGLVLSAGFFGFYGHAGFLAGLESAGLRPSAYAGTSAGGLVGAMAAAGVPVSSIQELLLSQRREHFWDPLPSRMRTRVGGPFAYPQAMDTGMSACRREHFQLQLKVLEARGIPVHVITSELPEVGPKTMHRAEAVIDTAKASALRALSECR